MSSEPSLPSLVAVFARVGALAFGGGVTSHLLVQFTRRGWLTDAQYLDAVSWCQNLPGPNATNLSAFLGWRFGGAPAALLCTIALVVPGTAVVLGLSQVLAGVPQQAVVRGGLAAVAAAAVGLLIAAMWQLGQGARLQGLRGPAAAVTAVAVALGVPTPLAIAVMVALLWPRGRTPVPVLLDLFLTFAYLGLISVGGAMTVIPEMERQIVIVHGWMTHQAFVDAYALGQFAPGPNMLHVFLVGYRVAQWPGALAAGLGMFGPTSLLLAGVAHVAAGPRPPGWVTSFQRAMGPVTIGLMGAAAWTLGRDSVRSPLLAAVCGLAAVAVIRKWLDPAWVVVIAAALGALAAAGGWG